MLIPRNDSLPSLNIIRFAFETPLSKTNRSLRSSSPLCGPCSGHEPSLSIVLHSGHLSIIPEPGMMATITPLVEMPLLDPPFLRLSRSTSTQWLSGSIFSQGVSASISTCSKLSITISGDPCHDWTLPPSNLMVSPGLGSNSHQAVSLHLPVGSMTSPLLTILESPSFVSNVL